MNQEQREHLFDLLTQKATYGLDATEQAELEALDEGNAFDELAILEMTAAAINLSEASSDEKMPEHLYSRILADAGQYVVGAGAVPEVFHEAAPEQEVYDRPAVSTTPTGGSWFGWLGWAAAAAACIALAINIWIGSPTTEVAIKPPRTVETPQPMTPAEMRDAMMASTAGLVKATWGAGNMKELKLTGDIVWSDEKQAGYMRFRGLPVNDVKRETYQLWIFDKTQDKLTPIDGGTFDVTSDGEVVIPINAKLKAVEPSMFAITMEKPGGVVVSKREKIAALAQVAAGTS